MIKIIDELIPPELQDEIEEYIFDPKFPYRFHKIHNYGDEKRSPLQLTHHLYMHDEGASPHFKIITPVYGALLHLFGEITLFRAKVNVTTPSPPYDSYMMQEPHIDMAYDDGSSIQHYVCVYYINDADGPTVFFHDDGTKTEIQPKKGLGVIFDGSIIHAGSNPINHPFRAIINIDFRQGSNQIP